MANEFVGIWNTADPAEAMRRRFGREPSWHDDIVAFGGAPVWYDAESGLVVSGEYVPDNAAPSLADFARLAACHGPAEAARRATGMFAVAVWDTKKRVLTLLRDRVGARTLYHAHDKTDGSCWFAARLRTLRRGAAFVADALSLPALRDYLTCAYVPGAQTLWRDIAELRPGTLFRLPGGATETYWTPRESDADTGESLDYHAARLRPLLDDAVCRSLPPEGDPVSIFLSGGLDSSLVTALAARHHPGSPVHTFAIHFGGAHANELAFSQMVADHCRTRHHVLELPARLIRRHLAETISALDDPIGDPLTVPNLLLGRAASQETGVVLNGEGGDPCFGGPKNLPMLLHELYGDGTHEDRTRAYFRSYQKCYDDLTTLFTPEALSALQSAPPQNERIDAFLGPDAPMRHYLNRLMQINVNLKGADHILTKVNNLTTACGLVGRSPLFDPRIVEAGFAIPPAFKLAGSEEKAVLKAAVYDMLPKPILTRPKSGMLVPVQHWFRHDLRRYAAGLLLSRRSRIRPYIRQEVVREWLAYRRTAPFAREGIKLWLLLTLEIWLRENE